MNELKVGMIEEKTLKMTPVNTVLTEMLFSCTANCLSELTLPSNQAI